MNRRSFIKGFVTGGASLLAGDLALRGWANRIGSVHASEKAVISVVRGKNYLQNTVASVKQLGGMARFVPPQAKVGLLVNSPFRNPACHASPDVVLAVIRMCYEAGAKEIHYLKDAFGGYWDRSKWAGEFGEEIRSLKPSGRNYVNVAIPKGLALKRAEIIRELLECDVFINVPVTKDHEGCRFTGALKNMMGTAPHSTCRFFHLGTGRPGWYGDVSHLNQCIADINLVRKPDLIVCDATEFVVTNGPFGPGEIRKAQTVMASSDPVALDAYGCRFLELKPKDLGMIRRSAAHGLGQMDLRRVDVQEMVL
jgi:uncharacterized protein (DUF362 family)